MNDRRLYRSDRDRVLAGVAGGMAETYGWDPALVRVTWALLILVTGGVFLVLYVVMALVVPLEPEDGTMSYEVPPGADAAPSASTTSMPPGPPPAGATRQEWREWRRANRHYRRQSEGSAALVIGLLLVLLGALFLTRHFIPALDWGLLWPVLVIGVGALLILGAFTRRDSR
jgi:phage shock protein C